MPTWPILEGAVHLATHEVHDAGVRTVGGACDEDPDRALARAAAEARERNLLLSSAARLVATRAEVVRRGVRRVAPHPDMDDDPWWVVGTDSHGRRPLAAVACVALLGWTDGSPLRWKQSSAGTAVRDDPRRAFEDALAESVERLAVRRVWRMTAAVAEVANPCRHLSPALARALQDCGLRPHAWRVAVELPVTVVLAALSRADHPQITFGAAARTRSGEAAATRHAILEAVSVRAALAGRSEPAGATDLEQVRDIALTRQDDFLDALASLVDPDTGPGLPADGAVPDLASAVEERFGVPVVRLDLPTPEGDTLVRVHVPHPEFLPPMPDDADYVLAPGYLD